MPFIEKLSAANRASMYEIGNLDEEKAVSFLIKNNVNEQLAMDIFSYVGGRLVHLQSCLNLVNLHKAEVECNDIDVCNKIKKSDFFMTVKCTNVGDNKTETRK